VPPAAVSPLAPVILHLKVGVRAAVAVPTEVPPAAAAVSAVEAVVLPELRMIG
jgi:hypothetical protein